MKRRGDISNSGARAANLNDWFRRRINFAGYFRGIGDYFFPEAVLIKIVSGFERILGTKSILIGFGLSEDAIHSPNESYGLEQFDKGLQTIPLFYKYFAK